MRQFVLLRSSILLLFVVLLGISCKSKAARKKLPDFTSLSGFETTLPTTSEQEPFYAGDTAMYVNGNSRQNFLLITASCAAYDSLAESMIDAYKPMAATLFHELVKQGKKGVVLDLRSTDGHTHRADFTVKLATEDDPLSLPVVFLWNGPDEVRVTNFLTILQSMPSLKCSRSGGEQVTTTSNRYGRQDCFSGNSIVD